MNKIENMEILFSEEDIQSGIAKLADKLNGIYKDEEIYLICILRGAVMFMVDLSKRLTMPVKMEFLRLSSYGPNTYSSGKITIEDMKLPDLNGKNVLIIEDIIDTGLTAEFIMNLIRQNYATKSLKFCSLLNKKSKRQADIDADYYVFDIDDIYVVGYGMDIDGNYRNLPYVGYIKQ